jgi:transient receptor potential cation channel subfamily M protein 3
MILTGPSFTSHSSGPDVDSYKGVENQQWMPNMPTGTIEFQDEPHKAQYWCLAQDTEPKSIIKFLKGEWKLERPKLVITVQGDKDDFVGQPKLKKVLRRGLLKAAESTGVWIFTGGTNTVKPICASLYSIMFRDVE